MCKVIYITKGFIRAWSITVNVRPVYLNKVLKIKGHSFLLSVLHLIARESWMLNHLQVKATFLPLCLGILTQSHVADDNTLGNQWYSMHKWIWNEIMPKKNPLRTIHRLLPEHCRNCLTGLQFWKDLDLCFIHMIYLLWTFWNVAKCFIMHLLLWWNDGICSIFALKQQKMDFLKKTCMDIQLQLAAQLKELSCIHKPFWRFLLSIFVPHIPRCLLYRDYMHLHVLVHQTTEKDSFSIHFSPSSLMNKRGRSKETSLSISIDLLHHHFLSSNAVIKKQAQGWQKLWFTCHGFSFYLQSTVILETSHFRDQTNKIYSSHFSFNVISFLSYGIEIDICGAENYYKETETRARCLKLLSQHNLGVHFFQALKFYEDTKESTRLLNLSMEIHLVVEK